MTKLEIAKKLVPRQRYLRERYEAADTHEEKLRFDNRMHELDNATRLLGINDATWIRAVQEVAA